MADSLTLNQRKEALDIEEADAWFTYRDATAGLYGKDYVDAEVRAGRRLDRRLRLLREDRLQYGLAPS